MSNSNKNSNSNNKSHKDKSHKTSNFLLAIALIIFCFHISNINAPKLIGFLAKTTIDIKLNQAKSDLKKRLTPTPKPDKESNQNSKEPEELKQEKQAPNKTKQDDRQSEKTERSTNPTVKKPIKPSKLSNNPDFITVSNDRSSGSNNDEGTEDVDRSSASNDKDNNCMTLLSEYDRDCDIQTFDSPSPDTSNPNKN